MSSRLLLERKTQAPGGCTLLSGHSGDTSSEESSLGKRRHQECFFSSSQNQKFLQQNPPCSEFPPSPQPWLVLLPSTPWRSPQRGGRRNITTSLDLGRAKRAGAAEPGCPCAGQELCKGTRHRGCSSAPGTGTDGIQGLLEILGLASRTRRSPPVIYFVLLVVA